MPTLSDGTPLIEHSVEQVHKGAVVCLACGSSGLYARYDLGYGRVQECRRCGMAFTAFAELGRAGSVNQSEFAFVTRTQIYELPRKRAWARERLGHLRRFLPRGHLLEYGSSTGEFLYEAAAAGFVVTGVDLYPTLLPENSPPRASLVLSDAEAYSAPESFDGAVAFHLLEHLHCPGEFLSRVRDNLRPGGVLLVELPNYASFDRRLLGPRWGLFREYHVAYFSPRSLRALLEKRGWEVLEMRSTGGFFEGLPAAAYYPLRNRLWNLWRSAPSPATPASGQGRPRESGRGEELDVGAILRSRRARLVRAEQQMLAVAGWLFRPLTWIGGGWLANTNLRAVARKPGHHG